jgi:hypothetical protein
MKPPRRIQVEVEPLSDARWRKLDAAIERALDAVPSAPAPAPATPKRTARFVAGAAGVLAVAAAVTLFVRSRPVPLVEATTAPVPAHVETGAKRSFVSLGTASMDVGPESAVTATGDDAHGFVLVLERGSVECDVAPRAGRPPFVVQSGDVRVRVVGTRFLVRRDVTSTVVAVTHGTVEVAHDGATTVLHDGERWNGELPPVPPSAASSPEPSPETSTAAPSPARPVRAMAPGPTDQQLYEEAARLEARDPDAAIASYQKLAAKNGPWSANGLFAAGRLAAERKQGARARALLEDYLRHYPGGANAEDARSLLARLP